MSNIDNRYIEEELKEMVRRMTEKYENDKKEDIA